MATIDPLTAGAVLIATAATDAVYVMFTSAVVARKRVPAATWSSVWYLLSSYAVKLHRELGLRRVCGGGIMARGVRVDHVSAPAPGWTAGGGVAGVGMPQPSLRGAKRQGNPSSSFRDAPLGAGPESIDPLTLPPDGFRARAARAPE
jgi:hypothetical protein